MRLINENFVFELKIYTKTTLAVKQKDTPKPYRQGGSGPKQPDKTEF
jgi:hypothetical protein